MVMRTRKHEEKHDPNHCTRSAFPCHDQGRFFMIDEMRLSLSFLHGVDELEGSMCSGHGHPVVQVIVCRCIFTRSCIVPASVGPHGVRCRRDAINDGQKILLSDQHLYPSL